MLKLLPDLKGCDILADKALNHAGDDIFFLLIILAVDGAALFLADRVAHNMNPVNGIEKTLEAGIDVVCDRYYYSSIAYQAVGEDRQWVIDMNLNCPGILKPDICIFFDVDPESCHERIENGRVYLEIFERDPEQINAIRERYYSAFELLKDRDNIVVIDAARDIDSVAADVRKAIDTVIK